LKANQGIKIKEDLQRRAREALNKEASLGPDIDLSRFTVCAEKEAVGDPGELNRQLREAALYAGVDLEENTSAGVYLQVDRSAVYERIQRAFEGKLEIMSISKALEKYPELWEYYFSLVPVDADKYTAFSELYRTEGYFIRVFAHQKVEIPLQTCLLISENQAVQSVHNLVVMEEGSEANLITGCAAVHNEQAGLHIGVSEFFIGDNARLTFTMIHNWGENFHVRPRTVVRLGKNAFFGNTYVLLKPLLSLQTFPKALLEGENSSAVFRSIIFAKGDSYIDVGSTLVLKNQGCSGDSISRVCAQDRAQVFARGRLVSHHDEAQAHLECKGILFSREASIVSVPELEVYGAPRSRLSHEAAVGPIEEEVVNYLRARGLRKEEALSLITRGFLGVDIPGIPPALKKYIDEIIAVTSQDVL